MSGPVAGSLEVRLRATAPVALDLALACRPREVLALVGPSGSGKSTVLRAILGTHPVAEGLVRVGGCVWLDTARGVARPVWRRRAGMVFQDYALFPHMSALDNVAAAVPAAGRGARRARARELLARMNLSGLEDRRPAALSGGQRQRVALARALARRPEVLLLDEPFSAVDRATRERLYMELAALRSELMMPVLLVTHDLAEATMLADRLAVVHHGRLLQEGTPEEIRARPATAQVAALVGVRNVFRGRWRGDGVIDWNGLPVETAITAGPAPGTPVCWIVPESEIVLHRRDRPSRGERENPVPGRVIERVDLGPQVRVRIAPDHDPAHPLHLELPRLVADRNAVRPGEPARVSLLAKGVHLLAEGS